MSLTLKHKSNAPQGSTYISYKALEKDLEGLSLLQEKLIEGICKWWKRKMYKKQKPFESSSLLTLFHDENL